MKKIYPVLIHVWRFWLIPGGLYLLVFALLTWPWVWEGQGQLMAGPGDGPHNVWNLWWVDRALTLGDSYWFSDMAYAPDGISLYGHALNPLGGILTYVTGTDNYVGAYNWLLVGGFVLGGLSGFHVSFLITGSYVASLAGGLVFSFNAHHLAHAREHLEQVSIQWLGWYAASLVWLVKRPGVLKSLLAGSLLWLCLLTSPYFLWFGILLTAVVAGVVLVQLAIKQESRWFWALISMAGALVVFLALAGNQLFGMFRQQLEDPLTGRHSPSIFLINAKALVVPGGYWRFFESIEQAWPNYFHSWLETSGYLTWSGLGLGLAGIVYGLKKKRVMTVMVIAWVIVFLGFALGPEIKWGNGVVYDGGLTPYRVITSVFFPLKLSGVPGRAMVGVYLGLGVLVALGSTVLLKQRWGKVVGVFLLAIYLLEVWPSPLPVTGVAVGPVVERIAGMEETGGLLDVSTKSMYWQTIHEKPQMLGYISRLPESNRKRYEAMMEAYRLKDLDRLCQEFEVEYLLEDIEKALSWPARTLVMSDDETGLIDVGNWCDK